MRTTRDTASDSSSSVTKTQSILSKLTASFTPKKRNLAEYYVRAKEPHRQYSPGDRVEGSVVVTLTKPARISHLVVCLHGFVKVFNSEKAPGQSISCDRGPLGGGAGRRGSEYFGNGFASLFENEIVLCGEGRLEVGSFEFQFDLELPSSGLPSSLNVRTSQLLQITQANCGLVVRARYYFVYDHFYHDATYNYLPNPELFMSN